jgi:hypothetical protein
VPSTIATYVCYTVTLLTTIHRAKFSYTNYAGKFTVLSGEHSPGGRRHDTFNTHKASGKNKYKLPMNMNMNFTKPKAAKMGPARVASAASIEEGNCGNDDDNKNTNNNVSTAFPGERTVLQALGQRWRALLGAATVSSSGGAKRRRSSLKPFLSNSGDAPQSPTAELTQRSVRVSVQEHPRTHNSNGTSARSTGSAQGFTALVPLSPAAAPAAAGVVPAAAAAPAVTPAALEPCSTLHNVMVEGHITSSDLQTHLAPLLARLFIEEQRKMRAARSGATAATTAAAAAKPEPADCYSSKNTVIVVSGPPGFSDQVDALLKSLAVPTHMVLFLD